jgi:ABC-type branched-subunit amino acid transport system substrate-binding protein
MIHLIGKRDRRYRYLVPAVLCAALLFLAACSSSSKNSNNAGGATASGSTAPSGSSTPSAGDIKIMVIAPFTLSVGPAKANYDAVRIQADDQNAKGGINGHKIDVIGCDDQSDPNVMAKCAQQAVSDHVVALVGEYSLVSNVLWPIITPAGIPSIGMIQFVAADQTAAGAYPINPPVVFGEAGATAYLAKQKGCKAIADAQGNTGSSALPEKLNKEAAAAEGAKYVGPFLLPITGSLANASAIAKSITSKADCANISDGENGIELMKAILQVNPNFHFATVAAALPGNWASEMGSEASAVSAVGGLAPVTSTSPGVQAYVSEMKAKAPGDTLNDFSEQAWASFYAFAQVAATIKGDITAQSMTTALGQASGVTTEGMTGTIDFTKATPLAGVTRLFSTQLFVLGGQDGKVVQIGTVDAKDYLTS